MAFAVEPEPEETDQKSSGKSHQQDLTPAPMPSGQCSRSEREHGAAIQERYPRLPSLTQHFPVLESNLHEQQGEGP